jgi:hypothetical protein
LSRYCFALENGGDIDMNYEVDGWNNFCRVFELPEEFSSEFCFGGGHPTNFQMVDWFYPVPNVSMAGCSKETWREKVGEIEITTIELETLITDMVPFLLEKRYVKQGRKYLVLCDFGASFTFLGEKK